MLAFLLAAPMAQAPVVDLIRVSVRSPAALTALQHLLHDVDDHLPALALGYATAYATDAEQSALAAAGVPYTVETEDLAAWYAARAAADPGTDGGPVGSMGGFRTWAEILAEMDRLAASHPAIVSPKFSIGSSLQGRPIYAMRISATPAVHDPAKPVAWFDALHHAREPISAEAVLQFAGYLADEAGADPAATRIVATRNSLFIPCANPDGYEYNRQTNPNGGGIWRKNRRNNGGGAYGVDLNRNYAWEWGPQWPGSSSDPQSDTYRGTSPFSEPETASLRDLLAQQTPGMSLSCHSYGNLLVYSWGYNTIVTPDDGAFRRYGADMTAANPWDYGTVWQMLYIANGGSIDWHYGQHGAFAFTPEIGGQNDGFWPAPARISALVADAHPALLRAAEWTGGWAETLAPQWTEASGDGDAAIEPGESWDLVVGLQNGGVLPVQGSIALVSSSPDAVVATGALPLALAPRSIGASPSFRVDFAASAPPGVVIPLDLVLDWEAWSDARQLAVTLGGQRVILRDAMETGDWGWSATGAANWAWQRADPERTTNLGQTVQPGDDHSPAGALCWVTGPLAGASADANDVDGTTRLKSAPLHLSEFSRVELAYWRWFANDPPQGGDDHFLAEASADGGAHWVTLEQAGNDAQWREVTFELGNFIPLTDEVILRFTVADVPDNDLTEGLLDDLELRTSGGPTLALYGPAAAGASAQFFVNGTANGRFDLAYSFTRTAGVPVPGISGLLFLGPGSRVVGGGFCDADGLGSLPVTFPPTASGRTVHFQALASYPSPRPEFTNALTLVFP